MTPAADGEADVRDEVEGEDDSGAAHEPFETLRQAAKAVAAAAAVGAAVGAARAFTSRDRGDEDSEGEADESEQYEAEALPDHEEDDADESVAAADEALQAEQAATEEREPEEEPEEESEPEPLPAAERQEDRREDSAPEDRPAEDGAKPLHGESLEETTEVLRRAGEQLRALQGREPESLSSLERTDGGWTATFEVVELARVPNSMDVLASYEVVLDEQKNMVRLSRARRYYRAQAGREGDS